MAELVPAKITFNNVRTRRPAGPLYRAGSRLPSEPPGHGQWTLVVDGLTADSDEVRVGFLVNGAPHHELKPGTVIELFEGASVVGHVTVKA